MSQHDKQSLSGFQNRRRFLKATGSIASIGLLAGCSGNGDGGSGDGGSGDGGSGDGGSDEMNYPEEDIELIIPYGPGGGFDTYSRLTAEFASNNLPVDIVPRNVDGGGGVLGTEEAYNSDPDGYTIQILSLVSMVQQQLQTDVNFDVREMTPFPQATADRAKLIGVGSDSEVETWDDFITATQNGELVFGTSSPAGAGTRIPVTLGELGDLWDPQNVVDNSVVFEGKGGWSQALLSGDVDTMIGNVGSVIEFVESGDVNPILLFTEVDYTDVPGDYETLESAGINNSNQIIDMNATLRVFTGPPGIPEERANVLRDAISSALQNEELVTQAEESDRPIRFADSSSVDQSINNVYTGWSENQHLMDLLFGS